MYHINTNHQKAEVAKLIVDKINILERKKNIFIKTKQEIL